MIKLYRRNREYWETWEKDENSSIIHYGIVGEKGKTDLLENSLNERREIVKGEIKKKIEDGFRPITETELETLVLEYKTTNNTQTDFTKRSQLESKLNELLGWFGLGHCDGGTSNQDILEIYCLVIDYNLAYKAIVDHLSGTEFSNYSKIYKQDK